MIIPGASESSREINLERFGFPLPIHRPRRLRINPVMRAMTAEMTLTPKNLILPMFVADGIDEPKPISSLSGVMQHTEDFLVGAVREVVEADISTVDLFGVLLGAGKDGEGSESRNPEGVLNRVLRRLRDESGNDTLITADTCLDEFTDHGHYGVLGIDRLGNTVVENDRTLINYVKIAAAQTDAGAHIVFPSGMMDGQIAAVCEGLDAAGHEDISIVAYSVKYASAFYGPFREAVGSSLQDDRRTYQQNSANRRESLLEVQLDVDEGVDMVMVKPAMSYLDILREVADMSPVPVVAYQVPGEYAMIYATIANEWIDLDAAMMEAVLSIRRAGVEQILTYAAVDLVKKLRVQF